MTMQRFGEKLRTLRRRRSMSVRELAAALGYASHSYIGDVELGKKHPTIELALKVADFFGVTVDQLVRDEQDV
ncbi:MAG: helix-turn-helix transcriptional regulator [Chloroflexaceae bacterium]|nr:helix-turn-helix transcriptional regulator [Chloroflexaceae bacterium]